MRMNIHPVLVHFPVALLTLYSVLEILPLAQWWPKGNWDFMRSFLLYLGTLTLYPVLLSGFVAEDLGSHNGALPYHKVAALITVVIFTLASLISLWRKGHDKGVAVQKVFAVLGLIALVIVGTLGGAVAYGYYNDPFTSMLTSFFGLQ
ncbi:MAG: hypothetical protein JO026_00930 [Patescibacteria group bacterium]|nr:hypothetical protein [Patescibacteria group bacterium]